MKSIIIIGAGMAGLSAGIYARKNGYDATIYESHNLPGGMCTAWERKDYTFEGCLSFCGLVGSSPTHTWHYLWEELGVVPSTPMIYHDTFHTFRDQAGHALTLYSDADRLKKELLALSPADAEEIKALCTAIKRYSCFIRTAGKNPIRLLAKLVGILAAIPLLKKYGAMNLADYAARFTHPLIRYAITNLFVFPDFSCVAVFFFLAGAHIKGSGFPQGSSLGLAKTIERVYLGLNGKIEYKKKVKRILVEGGRATGIALDDGTEAKADIIISAADGHATLFDMLEDKFTTPAWRERFATYPVFSPFIQVSLGVDRDMSGTPHAVKAQLAAPFVIAGQNRDALWYHHYAFDPTMAPRGKSTITVWYMSDLAWWEKFTYPSEAYEAEKKKILDATINQLEQMLPGISTQVEASDVATPVTWSRYTHNWKAALSFMLTKTNAAAMYAKPDYALPGLENFYMIGQWVEPGGGVPTAAISARNALQLICHEHQRPFVTSLA